MINQLVDHQEKITTVTGSQDNVVKTVAELKDVFYAQDKKLDVFETINLRLAEGEAGRQILDSQLKFEVNKLQTQMDAVDERNRIAHKVFESQTTLIKDVGNELRELKDTYTTQSAQFVEEVKKLDTSIINHQKRLTDYCQRLEKTGEKLRQEFELT